MININYSSTYSFQKPISDEKYNIGVFNTNMDLVDSVLNRVEKKNENQDESITKAQADIDNEVSRATEKEKELEQDLQDEVIRASSAENELSNDLSLEIDRAVNSEESIRTDLSALISALTERLNTLADSCTKKVFSAFTNNNSITDEFIPEPNKKYLIYNTYFDHITRIIKDSDMLLMSTSLDSVNEYNDIYIKRIGDISAADNDDPINQISLKYDLKYDFIIVKSQNENDEMSCVISGHRTADGINIDIQTDIYEVM